MILLGIISKAKYQKKIKKGNAEGLILLLCLKKNKC